MGVPKRVPSLNTQVEGNCKELGGDRAIHRRALCTVFPVGADKLALRSLPVQSTLSGHQAAA